MAATYVLTEPVGKVRLLIPDRDLTDPAFQDDEIEQFLVYAENSEREAAALALEVAATDEVLTFKVMKSGSDSVDASKAAAVLLDRASRLRAQEPVASFIGQIGVIEQAHGVFGRRQVLDNAILRQQT